MSEALVVRAGATPKRLDGFARWLPLWVVLCTLAGVAFGLRCPALTPWISPDLADQYVAGVSILAAAPCTAMGSSGRI
jgi:ACR3 family arsenite transporter